MGPILRLSQSRLLFFWVVLCRQLRELMFLLSWNSHWTTLTLNCCSWIFDWLTRISSLGIPNSFQCSIYNFRICFLDCLICVGRKFVLCWFCVCGGGYALRLWFSVQPGLMLVAKETVGMGCFDEFLGGQLGCFPNFFARRSNPVSRNMMNHGKTPRKVEHLGVSWNRGPPESSIFMGFPMISRTKKINFWVPPWLWQPPFHPLGTHSNTSLILRISQVARRIWQAAAESRRRVAKAWCIYMYICIIQP